MAVAFDAVGPSASGATSTTSTGLTWSHTNNGNALIVGVAMGKNPDSGISISSVTYAGVSMTGGAIVHSGNVTSGFLQVFTLLNPATGANNVVVTAVGGVPARLTGGSISVTGAGSFNPQYSANTPTSTTNATATSSGSTSGSLICAFVCDGSGTTSATSPSTSQFIANEDTNTAAGNCAGATSPGTGSNVTTAWLISSDDFAVIGVEVLPSGGGTASPSLQRAVPGPAWIRHHKHGKTARKPRTPLLPPPIHAPLYNGFEEGTTGTTLTAGSGGNTAGAGVNYLDTITIAPSGGLVQFSNAQAAHGSLSCLVSTSSSTSTGSFIAWNTSFGTQTAYWGRCYVYLTAAPATSDSFIEAQTTPGTFEYGIQITTGQVLLVQDAGFATDVTFTTTMTTGQWWRIEWGVVHSTSTGSMTVNLYSFDSVTPTETHTVTGKNFGASANQIQFGFNNGHANQPTTYIDDIGIGFNGFLGPATPTGPIQYTETLVATAATSAGTKSGIGKPLGANISVTPTWYSYKPVTPYLIANSGQASGSTTYTIPIIQATNAGDGVVVLVGAGGTTPPAVTSVTDSQGQQYIIQQQTGTSPILVVATAPGDIALAITDTLTITFATAATGGVSVVAAAAPGRRAIDVNTAPATGNSTTPSVTGTPLYPGEVAFGCFVYANAAGTGTINAPFTQLGQAHPSGGAWATIAYDWGPVSGSPLTGTATITSGAWRAVMITLRPVSPWYMSNASYIHEMYQTDPVTTSFFFNLTNAYAISTNPTSTNIQDGFVCTPILKYTSFAQLQSDITGGAIAATYKWLMYDNEYSDDGSGGNSWPTPMNEADNPWAYMGSFTTLAHANSYKVMLAPGRDLGNNTALTNPKNPGETLDQWYIRTNIAGSAASAGAEVVHIQAQADTVPLSSFLNFWDSTLAQVADVSASAQVSVGVSTNYGAASDMAAAAKAVANTAWGYWLNATDATIGQAVSFLQLMLAPTNLFTQLLNTIVAASGAVINSVSKTVSGSIAVSASAAQRTARMLVAVAIAAGLTVKRTSRVLSGQVAATGILSAVQRRLLIFAAQIAATASAQKKIGRVLAATAAVTGILGRTCARAISVSAAIAANVTRQANRTVTGLVTGTAQVVTAKFRLMLLVATVAVPSAVSKGILRSVSALAATPAMTRVLITRSLSAQVSATASAGRLAGRILTAAASVISLTSKQAGKPLSGAVNLSAGIVNRISKFVAGICTTAGSVIRGVSRSVNAMITVTATTAAQRFKIVVLAVTVAVTSVTTKQAGKLIIGTVSAAGITARQTGKFCISSVSATSSLVKGAGKYISVPISVAGNVTISRLKLVMLTVTLVIVPATQRSIGKFISTFTAVSGTVSRHIGKLCTATLAVTGGVARQIARIVTGNVTVTATMNFIKAHLVMLVSTIAVAASAVRQVKLNVFASVIMNASITRAIARPIQVSIAIAGQTVRAMARTISANTVVVVALSKNIGYIITAGITMPASMLRACRKALAGGIAVTAGVTRRISFHVIATVIMRGSVGVGRALFMALSTTISVSSSVIVTAFQAAVDVVFKVGVPAFQWVIENVKKAWRVGP